MRLKIPEPMEKKLENLEKSDRRRIRKKLDDIEEKLERWGTPEKAIEKRLRGPLHPLLQQAVGKWRLWFKEYRKEDVVRLMAVKTKEEAKKHY